MARDILLVEDNPDDVELTRIAFEQANIPNRLVVARDGAEALDYLYARGSHTGRDPSQLPALVLLDLNLPKIDGREVLQAIRSDPATQALPVVVLSTSREPDDVQSTYALHANSYIQKPLDFQQFLWAVKQVALYWLVLNLPGSGVPSGTL